MAWHACLEMRAWELQKLSMVLLTESPRVDRVRGGPWAGALGAGAPMLRATKGWASRAEALGRLEALGSSMLFTKSQQSADRCRGRARRRPAEMAFFTSALSLPSKGR